MSMRLTHAQAPGQHLSPCLVLGTRKYSLSVSKECLLKGGVMGGGVGRKKTPENQFKFFGAVQMHSFFPLNMSDADSFEEKSCPILSTIFIVSTP